MPFDALTPEPFEAFRVCVRASTIGPSAGDGLFAARALSPGEVVAFFGGARMGDKEEEEEEGEDDDDGDDEDDDRPPAGIEPDWCARSGDGW